MGENSAQPLMEAVSFLVSGAKARQTLRMGYGMGAPVHRTKADEALSRRFAPHQAKSQFPSDPSKLHLASERDGGQRGKGGKDIFSLGGMAGMMSALGDLYSEIDSFW